MSNLPTTHNYFPELSNKENIFISAFKSAKIINIPNEDLNKTIVNWANTLFATAGQKISDADLKAFCIMLKNELKTYFGNIPHKDIETALQKGVRNEFGDYYGINIVSINKWIKCYLDSDERKQAIKKYIQLEKPKEMNLSDAEKKQIMENAVIRLREIIYQNKSINPDEIDFGNAVYNYLDSIGKIHFTSAEKFVFFDEARAMLLNNLANKKNRLEITPSLFKKLLHSYEEKNAPDVIILAKKIAIKKYFLLQFDQDSIDKKNHLNPDYFNKF